MTSTPLFAHATLSLSAVAMLRDDMEANLRKGYVSDNATFRGYLDDRNFIVPEDFPWAKSWVIVASSNLLGHVTFHRGGTTFKAIVPGQYYSGGPSEKKLWEYLHEHFPGAKLERADAFVHHKLLAARSGLGRYGKNNICYVTGMGSFHSLHAFFIDREFGDTVHDLVPLDFCERCSVCASTCPTGAIRDDAFVIDAGRCLPLFNEIDGVFPAWIPETAHNALMGCLACQLPCPANASVIGNIRELPEITEEETFAILACNPTDTLMESLAGKIPGFYPAVEKDDLPVFSRNLGVLVRRLETPCHFPKPHSLG